MSATHTAPSAPVNVGPLAGLRDAPSPKARDIEHETATLLKAMIDRGELSPFWTPKGWMPSADIAGKVQS